MDHIPDEKDLDYRDEVHLMIIRANYQARLAMQDKAFVRYLRDKQEEAILTHGMNRTGNMMLKYEIPQDAYMSLPIDIQKNSQLRDEWVERYHPYFMISEHRTRNKSKRRHFK
jgi:hypothetical protein